MSKTKKPRVQIIIISIVVVAGLLLLWFLLAKPYESADEKQCKKVIKESSKSDTVGLSLEALNCMETGLPR